MIKADLPEEIQVYCHFSEEQKREDLYAVLLNDNWLAANGDLAGKLIRKLQETKLPYEKALEISHKAAQILGAEPPAQLVIKNGQKVKEFPVNKLVLASLGVAFLCFEVEEGVFQAMTDGVISNISLHGLRDLILLAKLAEMQGLANKAANYFQEQTGLSLHVKDLDSTEVTINKASSQVYLERLPAAWDIHLAPKYNSEGEAFITIAERYKERVKSANFGGIGDACIQRLIQACANLCELTICSPGLEELDVSGLQILSILKLNGCSGLKKLTLGTNLTHLELKDCYAHGCLDFSSLTNLVYLDLSGCWQYKTIGLRALVNLTTLKLRCCWGLIELPDLNYLTRLTALDLSRCTNLGEIKIRKLIHLIHLNLSGCKKATDFSDVSFLTKLVSLDMSQCWDMKVLPDLSALIHLVTLNLNGCWHVQKVCLSLKKLTTLTLNMCDAVDEVALSSSNIDRLDLSSCKKVKKLRLDNESLTSLQVARCTAFDELYLNDLKNIENVEILEETSEEEKGRFLAKFPPRVGRMATLKEIDKVLKREDFDKAAALFFSLKSRGDFAEILRLAVEKFYNLAAWLVERHPEELEQALELIPGVRSLSILPFLAPDEVKSTLLGVKEEERKKWLQEPLTYTQFSGSVLEVLKEVKRGNLDGTGEINPVIQGEFLKIVSFKAFAALALDPSLKEIAFAYLPLLNESRLAAAVPALTEARLMEFLRLQPFQCHASYLAYATHAQKEIYLEAMPEFLKTPSLGLRSWVFQTRLSLGLIRSKLLRHSPPLLQKINEKMEAYNLTLNQIEAGLSQEGQEEELLDVITKEPLTDPYQDRQGRILNKSTWEMLIANRQRNPFDRSWLTLAHISPALKEEGKK